MLEVMFYGKNSDFWQRAGRQRGSEARGNGRVPRGLRGEGPPCRESFARCPEADRKAVQTTKKWRGKRYLSVRFASAKLQLLFQINNSRGPKV